MGVFGDEGGFVLGEFSELGKIFRTSGVAKGDADVAKKSLKLDAFDGRFGKNLSEVFHRQVEKVAQGMSEDLLRAWKEASREVLAKRFHGQASRQSSHP